MLFSSAMIKADYEDSVAITGAFPGVVNLIHFSPSVLNVLVLPEAENAFWSSVLICAN